MTDHLRADFLTAMGESFSECVCPPIPFDDASPHECCEAVWSFLGDEVTPDMLASIDDAQIAGLADAFGRYFEASAPSVEQIRGSIQATLARWPVGSYP